MAPRPHLVDLDAALARLRRLWESPDVKRHFREQVGSHIEEGTIRTIRAIDTWPTGDVGVGEVAVTLSVDRSTASRLVQQAVSARLVQQSVSAVDRRRCRLTLTEQGASMLRTATTLRTKLLQDLTSEWADDEVAQLASLLDRLAEAAWRWTADDAGD